ncbi:hypothetical protein E8E11_006931 [Didymella keratinophila]|nr:hypothetical protein E8E11_006931 [Didymella keratinophila]
MITYNPETAPVEEAKRLFASEIKIEIAEEQDAHKIAEGLFVCYPDSSIDTIQPPHLRGPDYKEVRVQRLAKSFQPTFSTLGITWVKAVHIPTNAIIGAACWTGPDAPIVCPFRRDAFTLYGWQEKLGWSDAEIDELPAILLKPFSHFESRHTEIGVIKDKYQSLDDSPYEYRLCFQEHRYEAMTFLSEIPEPIDETDFQIPIWPDLIANFGEIAYTAVAKTVPERKYGRSVHDKPFLEKQEGYSYRDVPANPVKSSL